MSRKVRSDARLKNLPEERQEAIADYARTHSIEETIEWLRADGVVSSSGALSNFLADWRLSEQMDLNATTVGVLMQSAKREHPEFTESQIAMLGQAFFSALALNQQDPDIWVATQRLALDKESAAARAAFEREKIDLRKQAEARAREKLKFEREKWIEESCRKILAAATDRRAQEIAELPVSNEEKIALLRSEYFRDVDELEKSGEVKLPQ